MGQYDMDLVFHDPGPLGLFGHVQTSLLEHIQSAL